MDSKKLVPKWTRIVVGALAIANFVFGISNYFKYDALFQNSQIGVDLGGLGAKFASFEFGARNFAIGFALLIVALVGVPETIAIVTIIRALIELQSVIIALLAGTFGVGAVVAIVMFAVEIFIIKTMFGIVAKRDNK
ncbi:MAG: hypothetical protein PHV20_07840 [Bacteroidales bacterium]|nr:hypothetical protein [Bacteroidales bacterium]